MCIRDRTTTASRQHVIKHIPRVCPHLPASIDPRFVEIGRVQLSQSVKTTNVTHTVTDTQTNEIMAPCKHPGVNRPFCLKAKNGLGSFAPSALPQYETPPESCGLCPEQPLGIRTAVVLPLAQNPVIYSQYCCLLYTSPSPRDATLSRMPSSA